MNCDELARRLADYSDGAADSALCAEIERHLRECTGCEALRRELLELSRLCKECDPPRLPPAARARIERLLRGED
jgi:predicted anti-sigma-YlaC factor YlaD